MQTCHKNCTHSHKPSFIQIGFFFRKYDWNVTTRYLNLQQFYYQITYDLQDGMTSEVLKTGTDMIAEQAEVPIMRSFRCGSCRRNFKCVCGQCVHKNTACTTQGRQTACTTREGFQISCQWSGWRNNFTIDFYLKFDVARNKDKYNY